MLSLPNVICACAAGAMKSAPTASAIAFLFIFPPPVNVPLWRTVILSTEQSRQTLRATRRVCQVSSAAPRQEDGFVQAHPVSRLVEDLRRIDDFQRAAGQGTVEPAAGRHEAASLQDPLAIPADHEIVIEQRCVRVRR